MTGAAGSGGQLHMSNVREEESAPELTRDSRVSNEQRGWVRARAVQSSYWGQLAIALALAIAVRAFILVTSHGMMDGDEAVLGIQAERILQGAHPIYFYGQAYMGSWDAYLAAPLVALLGPTALPLHLVTLAESLLLVPLLGALATQLYGVRARLPAMLLAAIPPEYVAVGELRMLGGYVETLVLGTALLLLATVVARRWRDGRSTWLQWLLVGICAGLALWIDVLIFYYLVAAALWIAPHAVWRARRGWQERRRWVRSTLVAGGACILAMAGGATPAIIYAIRNNLANLTILTSHSAWLDHVSQVRGSVLLYLFTTDLPKVFGARLLWYAPDAAGLVIGLLAGVCAAAALVFGVRVLLPASPRRGRRNTLLGGVWAHWNDMLPLLLLAAIVLFYWRSSNTAVVYLHPTQDAGGRYALPATTVFSLLLVRLYGSLPTLLPAPVERNVRRRVGIGLAPLLLVALLAVYAIPYAISDNIAAMQSPETQHMVFPAKDSTLLTYLNEHHIEYLWSNQWVCHLVMYLENQRVVCGEYVDVHYKQAANRFPEAIQAVSMADRPSFVFMANPAQGEPAVARALDALGVTYVSAHFGSIWILTPKSRTVQPQEIAPALVLDY